MLSREGNETRRIRRNGEIEHPASSISRSNCNLSGRDRVSRKVCGSIAYFSQNDPSANRRRGVISRNIRDTFVRHV